MYLVLVQSDTFDQNPEPGILQKHPPNPLQRGNLNEPAPSTLRPAPCALRPAPCALSYMLHDPFEKVMGLKWFKDIIIDIQILNFIMAF